MTQLPDTAAITVKDIKAIIMESGMAYMGELVGPEVLNHLKEAVVKSLNGFLGKPSDQISVEAIRTSNTTADISLRGPYDIMKPLLKRMGYATEHSISISFTVDPGEET